MFLEKWFNMDEETAIIDRNTRNEKIKNFFINNKKYLIIIISLLLVTSMDWDISSCSDWAIRSAEIHSGLEYLSAIIVTSDSINMISEACSTGKPVNIFPLKNSKVEKITENNNMNEIFFSTKKPANQIAIPKNKDKNKGTNIRAKGIKPLNISSCVKDIAIQ